MHQTGELSKKTEQKKKCSFSFCYLFLCENCRWFLHPPIASLSSPFCRICLTGGKHSSKFIWPLYFFFFSVFYSCWFAKSQLTELWAVCPTGPLFWSVLQQKLEKPVRVLLFFFFFWSSSPIGSCSLYTCRQGGAYLSCGKLPYKNWGCFFHYPRAFLDSWRLWWMLQELNSVCSSPNVFR